MNAISGHGDSDKKWQKQDSEGQSVVDEILRSDDVQRQMEVSMVEMPSWQTADSTRIRVSKLHDHGQL